MVTVGSNPTPTAYLSWNPLVPTPAVVPCVEAVGFMTPTIAYIAEGKLYLKRDGRQPQLVESAFVQSTMDHASRERERNAEGPQVDGIG